VQTPGGAVTYAGEARIDGVPGTHAPVPLEFRDTAGLLRRSAAQRAGGGCGTACPTLIDNGMPCVVMKAADVGITGYETARSWDANAELKAKIEAIRLAVGERMNLGDVKDKSVPKMMLVAPPKRRRVTVQLLHPAPRPCHYRRAGAVSVVTACLIPGTPAALVQILDGARKPFSWSTPPAR
jgi:4-oxalomesaconate tautomerase